jgi:hypothetical protein
MDLYMLEIRRQCLEQGSHAMREISGNEVDPVTTGDLRMDSPWIGFPAEDGHQMLVIPRSMLDLLGTDGRLHGVGADDKQKVVRLLNAIKDLLAPVCCKRNSSVVHPDLEIVSGKRTIKPADEISVFSGVGDKDPDCPPSLSHQKSITIVAGKRQQAQPSASDSHSLIRVIPPKRRRPERQGHRCRRSQVIRIVRHAAERKSEERRLHR